MLSTVPTPRRLSIDPLTPGSLPSKLPLQKSTPIAVTSPRGIDQFGQSRPIPFTQQESIGVEMSDPITPSLHYTHLQFENLPAEIHEAVLDHLFGVRAATLASACPGKSSATSWSKALRHPRRKALSNLALVSPVWRPLVQERIYRHSQCLVSHPVASVTYLL
jgi:hypothetical protein